MFISINVGIFLFLLRGIFPILPIVLNILRWLLIFLINWFGLITLLRVRFLVQNHSLFFAGCRCYPSLVYVYLVGLSSVFPFLLYLETILSYSHARSSIVSWFSSCFSLLLLWYYWWNFGSLIPSLQFFECHMDGY